MMQKSDLNIRFATVEDISAIALIERECFFSPWSEKAISDTMCRQESIFLVAEAGGEICGYIGCYYVLDEGYITNVAVSESFRRRGIAKKLIEELILRARKLELSFVTLEVRSKNEPAISLYKGLGFCDVGLRPRFYHDPDDDARLMTFYI